MLTCPQIGLKHPNLLCLFSHLKWSWVRVLVQRGCQLSHTHLQRVEEGKLVGNRAGF